MGWTIPVQPVAYTPQIATDTTPRTAGSTSPTQVSGSFSIPANDAAVGSVYILIGWSSGNHPSGSYTALLQPQIFGVTLSGVDPWNLGVGSFAPDFLVQVYLIVTATGVSGSISGTIATQQGAGATGNNSIASIPATTVNTTVATTFQLLGSFSSVAASPTMTMNGSIYERDGPGAVAA
jgi:hypothetical protein